MSIAKRDYVDVIYNERDRPLTAYPAKLSRYLFDRYGIQAGQKLLDLGCGRGEFLQGFIKCGVQGYGLDNSRAAATYCPEAELQKADLENEGLPYADNFFDVIYSKSVFEHFYYPERVVQDVLHTVQPPRLVRNQIPNRTARVQFGHVDRRVHPSVLKRTEVARQLQRAGRTHRMPDERPPRRASRPSRKPSSRVSRST